MTTDTENATLIEKEQVARLNFPAENLERTEEQRNKLKSKLERATRLGNSHRVKMKIYFHDDQGIKRIDTTVWAVGDQSISLKGGLTIPIRRIVDVVM